MQLLLNRAEPEVYDPLDYGSLADSLMRAVLKRIPVKLESLTTFKGAGVYLIYYTGQHHPYAPYRRLAEVNMKLEGPVCVQPIYVGKAEPDGVDREALSGEALGTKLFDRLVQHRDSIIAASNLDIADFYCRYRVVTPVWIPLCETILIEKHGPLWNKVVRGFGNHPPGGKRTTGQRPMWDTIHPGRAWAENMEPNRYLEEEILLRIAQFLAGDISVDLPEQDQAEEADSDVYPEVN